MFSSKNYNEVQDVGMDSDDFLNLLTGLSDKSGIVVNVVDVFDFEGSFINAIKRIVGNKKIILVANKMDLLPKQINHRRVKEWLKRAAKNMDLKPKMLYLFLKKGKASKTYYIQSISIVTKKMFILSVQLM